MLYTKDGDFNKGLFSVFSKVSIYMLQNSSSIADFCFQMRSQIKLCNVNKVPVASCHASSIAPTEF